MFPLRLQTLGWLSLGLAAWACLGIANFASADALGSNGPVSFSKAEIYKRTLLGTVWIRNPKGDAVTMGTGSLIDGPKRLVITNHHVIEGFEGPLDVYFVVFKDGTPVTDPDYYLRKTRAIPGKVIDSESEVDLALMELEEVPETAVPLKLAKTSLVPGDQVHSVAGLPVGSSALWIYTTGVVRQVYRRQALLPDQIVDAMVVETQAPVNAGNSGGPVVNDAGELAAVVSFGRTDANLVECFIDQSEVHKYLGTTVPLVHPQTAEQFLSRGTRQFHEGRVDLAIDDLNQAIQLDPKCAEAYARRGNAYVEKEDYESAMGDFNEALSLNPRLVEAYVGRGIAYRDQDELDKSIQDFTDAIRKVPGAAELYNVFNERGISYCANEDFAHAVQDYTRALEQIDKKDKAGERMTIGIIQDRAQIFSNRADSLHRNGENDKAFEDIKVAVSLNPYNSEVWELAGDIQHSRTDENDALTCYSKAIELDPDVASYYTSRGSYFTDLERYQEAVADFAKAADLEPDDADNWNWLGIGLYNLEQYAPATEAYDKAIATDGAEAIYHSNRGDALTMQENYPAAIAAYTNAIRLDPEDAAFYAARGRAYQAQDNTKAASADFEKAVELDPEANKLQSEKYLAVANKTSEPLTVYVQYRQEDENGKWHWYPKGAKEGQAISFQIDANTTSNLYFEDEQILADRVKIWAVGQSGEEEWDDNKEEDFILVQAGGYLSPESEPETYTYEFTDEE